MTGAPGRVHVLHVDDEPTVLTAMENYVSRYAESVTIETTTDPESVVERLASGDFDCLLSDYEMPRMNGLAVLDAVQERGLDVPVIVYTGKGSEDIASEAISRGAADYVTKGDGMGHYADLIDDIEAAVDADPETPDPESPPTDGAAERSEQAAEIHERISGVLALDEAGTITDVDDVALGLLETDASDPTGQALSAVLSPATADRVHEECDAATATGAPTSFEIPRQPLRGIAHPGDDGTTIQFVVDRERADDVPVTDGAAGDGDVESDGAEEEHLDAIPDVVYALDGQGRCTQWNDTFEAVTGYSHAALGGRALAELVPEGEREFVGDAVERAQTDGDTVRIETALERIDGTHVPFEFTVAPVRDASGTITGVTGVGRDITERTRAERDLVEMRRKLNLALEATNTGVWSLNLADDSVTAYGNTTDLFGVDADETVLDRYLDRIHSADRDAVEVAMKRAIETGDQFNTTFRVVDTPSERWLHWRGQVVTDDDGEPTQMYGVTTDTTEQKEREQELRVKTRTMDEAPIGITITDPSEPDNPIVYVSDKFVDITGYERHEVVGQNCRFLQGEETDPEKIEDIRRAVDDREPVSVELRNYRKDGTPFWNRLEVAPVKDIEGTVTNFVGFQQDITDRKERRQTIAENEARFRSMAEAIDTSSIGTIILDEDFSVIWANEAIEEYFGLDWAKLLDADTEALLDTEIGDIFEAPERFTETVTATYEDNTYVEEFVCHVLPGEDREERWLLHRSDPIEQGQYAGGRVEHYTDITERKEREQELQRVRQRFERFAENVRDAFFLLPADYSGTEYVNSAVEDVYGITRADAYDDPMSWMRHVHPADRDDLRADMDAQQLGDTEWPLTQEFRVQHPERGLRWVRSRLDVIDNGEDVDWVTGITTDITDRKERERELERQNERLELLASTISHDLRNPLRSARTNLKMAESECESDLLDDVAFAHERMDELISDLLTLARQGEAVTDTESVDLATTAREVWDGVETGDATLDIEATTVQADRSRLRQLFENLFVNSVEHGSTGNRTQSDDSVEHSSTSVHVRVGPTERGFCLEDDGPGVPADEREAVFEYGYSNADTGTGFGLAIVEEIAEAHGWRVTLTESEAGGARFEFAVN